jgi:cation diffusion facilitator family transporter
MRYQTAKKVTLVSAFFNAILAVCKMIAGSLSGSHGLFADGIHSLSDLLTDFLVLIASKYGSQDADAEHPYGHRRIETAATFFLSLLLVVTGCAIIYDAILQFFQDHLILDGSVALIMIVASLVVNEGLFHYTLYYGKKLDSKLLIANAWHHRSDSLSSFVVLLGIVGNLFGYFYFDPLAAVVVGILICKMGWSIGWNSIQELVDKGIEPQLLNNIEQAIHQTAGVVTIHQLRTRSMGGMILVDVHVIVDNAITVSEGHYIGQNVALNIRNAIKQVDDVTVHIDPEDDEIANPSIGLPGREQLSNRILEHLQGLLDKEDIEKMNFHYLDGAIQVELVVKKGIAFDCKRCKSSILTCADVIGVKVFQSQ